MGANESTMRSAAMLMVLDRRKKLSALQLDYVETDEFKIFFNNHGDEIKKRACDLYGLELIKLIEDKRVTPVGELIDEIEKYGCKTYRAPNIYKAVQKMIESKNSNYMDFYSKLAGYVTYDSIIDSIIMGNINLYNKLKEPAARIPGTSRIIDPLRGATSRGKVFTLTDIHPKDLGLISIFIALAGAIRNNKTQESFLILKDLILYIQQIKLLSQKEVRDSLNDMIDSMQKGELYSLNRKLAQLATDNFSLPDIDASIQKKAYEDKFKSFVKRYPRIGIIEQFIN